MCRHTRQGEANVCGECAAEAARLELREAGWRHTRGLISDSHIHFTKYAEPEKSQLVIRGTVRLAVEIAIPMSDVAMLGDVSIAILGGKAGLKIEEALRADPLKYLVRLGEEIQRLEAPRLLTRGEGDTE